MTRERTRATRWVTIGVVALWLVLAAVAVPLGARLADVKDNGSLGALPASAEAARAEARIKAAFPGSDALVAVAVYARDGGLTGADRTKVDSDRVAFAGYAVGAVPPPVPSADGAALLVTFPLAGDAPAQERAASEIKRRLAAGSPAGLRTGLTGSAGGFTDVMDAFHGLDGKLLLVTAGIVVAVLLLTYRSPVLWLVPLTAVGVASQLASAVGYLLGRYVGGTVDTQSQSILTVLLFGVGIDYALLLIARYREELRRHADRFAAMAVALRRVFPAILASAATVAVSLLCLVAADMPATRGLGPAAAVGVLAAFAAMTTLLPALLVLLGRWLFWPFVPRFREPAGEPARESDPAADHRGWTRVAGVVGRHARPVWLASAALLGLLVLGIGQLSLGLPGSESFTTEVGSVTGQRLVERHFPGGASGPATIVAAPQQADAVVAAVRRVRGVAQVGPAQPSADGRWVRIEAVLTDDPDTAAARSTVQRLRTALHAVPRASAVSGPQALVGGPAAVGLDGDRVAGRDTRVVIPLILAVVVVVLVLLLRALVAPLLLLASVVLTYFAALGAAGLVLTAMGYQKLWTSLPLEAFLFLVALGVDYTIFVMTRAREETGRLGHRRGVLHALAVTGGVVSSAGLVLAATFSALGVLPLVGSVQMGVVVALGVLLDTLVVRTLLVPGLALEIGPRVWWPGRPQDQRASGRDAGAPGGTGGGCAQVPSGRAEPVGGGLSRVDSRARRQSSGTHQGGGTHGRDRRHQS